MTPLRQRYIDDLRVRNYSPRTIETYVCRVAAFAKHFGRSPEVLGHSEVRDFQLHMIRCRTSWSGFNQAVCAIRFLYGTTLGRPEQLPLIPYGKRPKTLPTVLSAAEVLRLLDAAAPGRDRSLMQVAYGCGLRLSELIHLKVADIDSPRMIIHVRQGKGAKDRLVPLSLRLLQELRAYWRRGQATHLAVPGPQARKTHYRQQRAAPFRPSSPKGLSRKTLLHAHPAAQLCHPPPRSWRRSPYPQGTPRTSQFAIDRSLSACEHPAFAANAQPT